MSLYQDHEGMRSHCEDRRVEVERMHPSDEKRLAEAAHLRRAQESRVRVAREKIHAIAMTLAEDGLSAETITAAMADMARTASERASKYIAEYDREEEDRLADRTDFADEYARG